MNQYVSVLKKYFVLQGRARRSEYWMFALFNFAIGILVAGLDVLMANALKTPPVMLGFVYSLGVVCPTFCVNVRRLHDIGRSGWWLLIGLIPIIGAIVLLIFSVLDSQPGDNKYGPNPKAA